MRIVTFLSDFGLDDPYVAEVKAVLLRAKGITIVDVTHAVPAHDIMWGAFQLYRAYRHFPKGTIHLAVVDPGVGSTRRPVFAKTRDCVFVGPDNGLLAWAVKEEEERTRTKAALYEIQSDAAILPTFHGRDLFAPSIVDFLSGKKKGLKKLDRIQGSAFPLATEHGDEWHGIVLGADHFGNLVTNISVSMAQPGKGKIYLRRGTKDLLAYPHYAAIPVGTAGLLRGSHGFWEIAVCRGSAKDLFEGGIGAKVTVV